MKKLDALTLCMLIGHQWCGQCARGCPVVTVKSFIDELVGHTELLAPFDKGFYFSLKFNQKGNGSIASLFGASGPTTVLRRVFGIIIFPFQCKSRRARSHVRDEVPYVVPAFAYGDTSGSVGAVARVFWVIAPSHHVSPSRV